MFLLFKKRFGFTALLLLSFVIFSEKQIFAFNSELLPIFEPFTISISAKTDKRGSAKKVVFVKKGNMISINANKNATWKLGPGPLRICNADGCTAFPRFGKFKYGALIGFILAPNGKDSTGWFLIGSHFSKEIPMSGWLYLACHDDVYDDNQGTISVRINVTP